MSRAVRDGRPHVVLMTPMDLRSDTRLWLQAETAAALGYRTTVVETTRWPFEGDVPFEVITLPGGRRTRRESRGLGRRSAVAGSTPERAIASLPREVWRGGRTTYKTLRNAWRLSRKPPSAARGADLYLTHGFLQHGAVLRASSGPGTPYVYDAADFYSARYGRRHVLVAPLLLALERRAIRRADAVLTASQGLADLYARNFGVAPEVIRNCQDRPAGPSLPGLRRRLGLTPESFLVVAVCRPKLGTAVEEAIRATTAGWPSHAHLAFLGRGYDGWHERLPGGVPADRVHFLEPVRSDEVVPFIESADLFLMTNYPATPNDRLTITIGFFQAVAARLPVLYPAALPEVARLAEAHGMGVPIDPLRPAAIAAAVERLARHPRELETLRRGATEAAGELSWTEEQARLVAVLTRLLGA